MAQWPQLLTSILILLIGAWFVVHLVFRNTFIFHDSWQHIFPISYSAARHSNCGSLAAWMGTVDSGSPFVIYVISFSITQIMRLPFLHWMGCVGPDIVSAIFIQKIQIFLTFFAFSGGMYALGRILFQRHLSALYLFVATLYSGLCMNALHSDQIISLIFWLPWAVACAVLFHRHRYNSRGAWYLNGAVFLYSLTILDEYPHIVSLVALVGVGIYTLLFRKDCLTFVKRNVFRLWPSIVTIVVLGIQLWIIQDTVADYTPSQRPALAVDPRAFSTSSFAQPTSFIGSVLPLGLLAGTEVLEKGLTNLLPGISWLAFNYKIDALLFTLGFIPIVFALAFVIGSGHRKLRIFWTSFAFVIILLASRQSGLYRLLFYLPTLNLFRSYYHFIEFALFAILVMSGYGIDASLALELNERKHLMKRSLIIVTGLILLAIIFVSLMSFYSHAPLPLLRQIYKYITLDVLLILVGIGVVLLYGRSLEPYRWGLVIVVAITINGIINFVGVYELAGIPILKVVNKFNLDKDDLIPLPETVASSPNLFRRKECTVFAQCYLSLRDTVSLQPVGHLEGTFFRSKEEALYQSGLTEPAVKALSGITHPVFWLSEEVAPYNDKQELVSIFNENEDQISQYLSKVVHVNNNDMKLIGNEDKSQAGRAELTHLERNKDVIRLAYSAKKTVFLNAAVTYDKYWVATVNALPVPLVRGNFNGLALRLPPGAGTVELRYDSWKNSFFFSSRYLFLIVALFIVGIITNAVRSHGNTNGTKNYNIQK